MPVKFEKAGAGRRGREHRPNFRRAGSVVRRKPQLVTNTTMLKIFAPADRRRQFCDGVSRRNFLKIGGLGAAGRTAGP